MHSEKKKSNRFTVFLICLLVVGWLSILGIKLHGRNAMINEIIDDSLEYVDTCMNKGDFVGAENMLNSIKETQTSSINIRKIDIKLAEIEKLAAERKNNLLKSSENFLLENGFTEMNTKYFMSIMEKINVYGITNISGLICSENDLAEICDESDSIDDKYGIYQSEVTTRRGNNLKIEVIYHIDESEKFSIIEIDFGEHMVYNKNSYHDIDEVYKNNLF